MCYALTMTGVDVTGPAGAAPGTPRRRNPWWRFGSPFLTIAAIAGAILWLSKPWDKPVYDEPGSAVRREAERQFAANPEAPRKGSAAPDFALRALDGSTVRLSELHGQVVVVNFWATWCAPCRAEMGDLNAIYLEQKDAGVTVLAINAEGASFGDARTAAQNFVDELGLSLPVLLDTPGGDIFHLYRLTGVPSTFVIDGQGVIRHIAFGPMNRDQMRKAIETARKAGS